MPKSSFEQNLHTWANRYFYRPSLPQKLLAYALLPLSLVYTAIIWIKKISSCKKDFGIKILSVGNLSLGGSGKTPLCIAIANEFKGAFIVLRGYKRATKGMLVVCKNGEILADTRTSGDEAMEYAISVKDANVIVSENRDEAIEFAKNAGARYVLMDDGFGKFHIKKFDILLRPAPKPALNFTIPSGAYRYPVSFYKFADFIAEPGQTHFRKSRIENPTPKMVLVTGIANPARLEPFFKDTLAQIFYPDHYSFCKDELAQILKEREASSLLMTRKDYVKVRDFGLPISLITLETTLSEEFKTLIQSKI
ncbi:MULTISPECIES: tetraacyldisaccharide 4'-kinase [Campylobacter]|uniref:tetraacyldisaccharide 4'-kinase n=1 Tax=Campylobacter TaxID=194 RepID=UPI00027A3486|nr:tetraacyldisaccharide 4'-kinase [Campylobacter sp. FOBRC14]EJP75597.1 tetraacyldisaccharide-1-P 4'-kinase [Campylobacter sp. FOBRC14]